MIRVPFDPESLSGQEREWWSGWQNRAEQATAKYIESRKAGEDCEFNSAIWSELKVWLLANVFHGKCAYCEVNVSAGFFGDAEHFRPKGNVTRVVEGRKERVTLSTGDAHGGYYWLAYDWRNLLPSCDRCNNVKSDQFEAEADYHASPSPDTLSLNERERPLLIHPYEDDPDKYLRFGKAGVVTAIDGNPRGKATIRILGLDRKDLMDVRWAAQSTALEALEGTVGQMLTKDAYDRVRVRRHLGPQAPFSKAVRDWFRERVRLMAKRLDGLTDDASLTRP